MHLSYKAGRFLPAVLSVALLLSTASAGVGYAEDHEEVTTITEDTKGDEKNIPNDYKLHIIRNGHSFEIELYCMDNSLHWPDEKDQYAIGDIIGENSALKTQLIKALYAGYPYNGMGILYDQASLIDVQTYNEYLKIPDNFKTDDTIAQILKIGKYGNEVYSYDDYKLNNPQHLENIKNFVIYLNQLQFNSNSNQDSNTKSLSAAEITETPFYIAAHKTFLAADAKSDPVEYWNNEIRSLGGAKYLAHNATQNAIWMILQDAGIGQNTKGVTYDKLAQEIYQIAIDGSSTILEQQPSDNNVIVQLPKSLAMTYMEAQNQWVVGPFCIHETTPLNGGSYTVEISDKDLSLINSAGDDIGKIKAGEEFYVRSLNNINDEASITVYKTVPWIEPNGLRQFTPPKKQAADGKGYQHMIGAIIHDTKITKTFKVKPAPDNPSTPSDMPSTPSNIPSTPSDLPSTPSNIPSTPSDIPSTPSDIPVTPETPNIPKETPDNSGDSENGSSGSSSGGSGSGSGGGSGSSGSTGIHSVFGDSRNTTTESKAGSTAESAAGTPPDDSNPAETIGGSVQGMNRNRPGQQGDVDGETAGASRSVQTGDHAHMILYLAVSLIALIGLLGWKRKADKQG